MDFVLILGYITIVIFVAKLLNYLSKYIKTPLDPKRLGEWALVTGATDGIGKPHP